MVTMPFMLGDTDKNSNLPTKKRDSQKSRQDLIDAAIEVFAQRGPEAATIDDICSKAGLNKRMLYHYFGSKELLYQEALGHVYQQFGDIDVALSSMLLPAEELIENIVRQHHIFLKNNQDFVRMVCFENLNYGRTAEKLKLSGFKAPVITALELALEKGQKERRFRANIDVPELLVSILSLCFFYFSNEHTMKQFASEISMTDSALEKRVKHVVDLLLHGIVDNGNVAD